MLTEQAKIEISRIKSFDGLELKSAMFLNKSFPIHFHEEYSLALIEYGSELLDVQKTQIKLNANGLILIPPHLPHANKGILNTSWRYRAIYINKEIINFLSKKASLNEAQSRLQHCVISYQPLLVQRFKELFNNNPKEFIEESLSNIITDMLRSNHELYQEMIHIKIYSEKMKEITQYLESNTDSKITLDLIASRFNIDKYKLLRTYKSVTGLTPQEYLTSLRIEKAKKMMFNNMPLANISLETGFFDQSHFTKAFIRYVGLTPISYRKFCNILQDRGL